MEKLVSVIVPIYNVEKYLDRCLQSIVGQTYPHLEIILVDDGSQDGSGKLCDLWAQKDSRIKVVHKNNGGLGMARNTGLDQAAGKYIFFFDSDDYVDKTVVEKCVQNAEQHRSDVVMFGRHNVYDDVVFKAGKVSATKLLYEGRELQENLLPLLFTYELGFGVSAWGKMFRMDIFQKHGLKFKSEREIISEDAYFILEFLSKATIATILPECLYYYCKRNNSLSQSFRKDRQLRNDEFLIQCTEYIQKAHLPDTVIPHIQSRYHGLTLGTMMQIVRSDLSKRAKRLELNSIYHNKLLHTTMCNDVFRLDAKFPRIFWRCLKNKQYWLCTLLLHANTYR